jgi:hypothetical protein
LAASDDSVIEFILRPGIITTSLSLERVRPNPPIIAEFLELHIVDPDPAIIVLFVDPITIEQTPPIIDELDDVPILCIHPPPIKFPVALEEFDPKIYDCDEDKIIDWSVKSKQDF